MNKNTKSHGMSESRLSKIGEHIKNNYINNNKYIGTSTLIYRNGEIAYLDIQGQQDRERSIQLNRDTIFRIYSMTKPITSVALMSLYEEGKIQLDDFVHKYIPSWKNLKKQGFLNMVAFRAIFCGFAHFHKISAYFPGRLMPGVIRCMQLSASSTFL